MFYKMALLHVELLKGKMRGYVAYGVLTSPCTRTVYNNTLAIRTVFNAYFLYWP